MGEAGYFGDASVIDAMSAEHRFLWRSLFRACGAHLRPGIRILDFGCGDGSMLTYLMRGDGGKWPGCRFALGVGIDRPALDRVLATATRRLGGELPVLLTSANPEDFPGQFDLVLSHEVIYLIPELVEAFRGLHAALRPGGPIILATGCHKENVLYSKWMEAFARLGVRAQPYGIPDYLGALHAAGFEKIEATRLRMDVEDYEEWVNIRGASAPNPEWFATADEERIYYTKFGKALITARRPRGEDPADEPRRERP
jgi:SAM-dependent methyltransferase